MLRGTRNLIFETITDLPFLIKSKIPNNYKWQIFYTYIILSVKLFTVHRISKITEEQILGFKISFFDYGTLHFLYREIFIRNIYYFEAKSNKPVIFDCGANIGIAVLYFKWLYPGSVIYVFEPDPLTFSLLEKNINQNNFKNVILHNIALYNKNGTADFYIDKKNPGWLTMSVLYERLPKDKIRVKTMQLSGYISNLNIDFLKMDVEGIEYDILNDLIKKKKIFQIKEMVIEYHHLIGNKKSSFSEFLSFFEKSGFKYRIAAHANPLYKQNEFQDINIYAYNQINKHE